MQLKVTLISLLIACMFVFGTFVGDISEISFQSISKSEQQLAPDEEVVDKIRAAALITSDTKRAFGID